MNIINHFVVVHPPKSGGTTAKRFLGQFGKFGLARVNSVYDSGHTSFRFKQMIYKDCTDMAEWFGVVRHPVARAISAHKFFRKSNGNPDKWIIEHWLKTPTDFDMLTNEDGKIDDCMTMWKCEELDQLLPAWAESRGFDDYIYRRQNETKMESPELLPHTIEFIKERFSWTLENFYADDPWLQK